ncbi:MAG: YicC family protein [Bacteroidaceae bacterium]|nr:YicC family protein [Bacteroidaceae bacterium]
MIQSMTGYGKADIQFAEKKIHVEIKSLNSKSLDLSMRLAPLYREKEMEIRQYVSQQLERGKIDLNIWIEKNVVAQSPSFNEEVVNKYIAQIREISQSQSLPFPDNNIWEVLVRLPEITQSTIIEEMTEEEWEVLWQAIQQAVHQLIDFRKQEGEALAAKFTKNLERIAALMKEIEGYENSRVEKIRQRLEERLAELKGVDYDKNRLEQELIYYIEKLDINEEKQRLTNHLNYFKETMLGEKGQGKKLGFIAQEMGREINTTGSKSNQAEMQNLVVMMKDELEQIKEQVLNVM